ncbi:MAG: replicative DNA helicase, partial [Hymenobacteraceae bacterium]|nr:replicative DNA helicase [Hymenobacteraceae bacterium]
PHDLPLEAAVLGAALLEARALRKALELLADPDIFYQPGNRLIWEAARTVFQAGQQVDMLTVMRQLREAGTLETAGGIQAIHQLTSKVTGGANIEAHIRILQQLYGRRLTMQAGRKLLTMAADDTVDMFDLFADAQNDLSRLTRAISTKRTVTAASLYDETIEQIARACATSGLTGIPTGWHDLDQLTGGWPPGHLILLAARPGMGKTTAALSFARQAALEFGRRVLFVSLEMPARELMVKLVATEANRTTFELAHGKLLGGVSEAYEIGATAHRVKSDRLLIDPSSSLTVGQLRARAAELKAEPAGLDMIFVDYVQLFKADSKGLSREEQVAEVSRGLKALALELDLPVMALAQLNRKAEERGDKRPQTSDLRESGQLEQDADVIIFPWRGEIYGIEHYDQADKNSPPMPTAGTVLLDFAKHRNGPVGEVILRCDIARGHFADLPEPAWTWKPPQERPVADHTLTTASQFEEEPA